VIGLWNIVLWLVLLFRLDSVALYLSSWIFTYVRGGYFESEIVRRRCWAL
jgi:hypothetical protein